MNKEVHQLMMRYFKRLKINIPLFFGFLGLHFYDNGSSLQSPHGCGGYFLTVY